MRKISRVGIVVMAALLVAAMLLGFYYYAYEGMSEKAEHHAVSQLRAKRAIIRSFMSTVETAINNHRWAAERMLSRPDSLITVARRVVELNPEIMGCAVALDPSLTDDQRFEPYAVRRSNGEIEEMVIDEAHDYTQSEFYTLAQSKGEGVWSEPYMDSVGAKAMLTTYAIPLHTEDGRMAGVLLADIALDWVNHTANSDLFLESSYIMIISRKGRLLAYIDPQFILNEHVNDIKKEVRDPRVVELNRRMLNGEQGDLSLRNIKGEKKHAYFAPVGGNTGWSMALICADKDVFRDLRLLRLGLLLMLLLSGGLIAFISYRSVSDINQLKTVSAERERIASELRIASNIQQSMLPRKTAMAKKRDDICIQGYLASAKEVGGDLYDHFVRDEKLFFCIGDVSGKGIPAALVMAVTRSLFRNIAARESQPARIMASINNGADEMDEAGMFVTLFVGVLDLPSGRLRYCNAGHCPPYVLTEVHQSDATLPVVPNLPIGVMPGYKFQEQETLLPDQATLFLYTDGLTEAKSLNQGRYGDERLANLLPQLDPEPEPLLKAVDHSVRDFVKEAEQSDDLTMLAIRYRKPRHEVSLHERLTLDNDLQQIPQLNQFITDIARQLKLDEETANGLKLATEEIVVNVMSYAYPPGTKGSITTEVEAETGQLRIAITDNGKPFDPTIAPEVDTTLSAEERPVGGLGIFLARQLMDALNYERIGGKNILTLIKHINNKK